MNLSTDAAAMPLLVALEYTFRAYLQESTILVCLCHYHLVMPALPYQVCGVYNHYARQLYLLVNPVIKGRSNDTSVLFVEWLDPESRQSVYARFNHEQAACLQRVVDEMK